MSDDIEACDVCRGTGYDERTRWRLHKRPCPRGCEVPDTPTRSVAGSAPAWLNDAARRGRAIQEEAERNSARFRRGVDAALSMIRAQTRHVRRMLNG